MNLPRKIETEGVTYMCIYEETYYELYQPLIPFSSSLHHVKAKVSTSVQKGKENLAGGRDVCMCVLRGTRGQPWVFFRHRHLAY